MSQRKPGDRAHSYYLGECAVEMLAEARRLDRPLTWLARRAWRIARDEIRKIPSPPAPGAKGVP